MRTTIPFLRSATFSAMALAALSVGFPGAPGAATPERSERTSVSERQTVGCGAGVVEVSWQSDAALHLTVYENNTAGARATTDVPAPRGEHSYASAHHTLTWAFADDDGNPVPVVSHARCAMYH
ncbi:hypothetical protein ACFQ9V_14200 [Leifsonia sp. NPDC056665]|uniref:hypothetical protein n=1 Tax=Leifsonia sp. NPDC056665 TaxID=3345901 RepID=UPI0036AA1A3B